MLRIKLLAIRNKWGNMAFSTPREVTWSTADAVLDLLSLRHPQYQKIHEARGGSAYCIKLLNTHRSWCDLPWATTSDMELACLEKEIYRSFDQSWNSTELTFMLLDTRLLTNRKQCVFTTSLCQYLHATMVDTYMTNVRLPTAIWTTRSASLNNEWMKGLIN